MEARINKGRGNTVGLLYLFISGVNYGHTTHTSSISLTHTHTHTHTLRHKHTHTHPHSSHRNNKQPFALTHSLTPSQIGQLRSLLRNILHIAIWLPVHTKLFVCPTL